MRKYNVRDIDVIRELEAEIFRIEEFSGLPTPKEMTKWHGWVFEDDDGIFGYLTYSIIDKNNWFIESLCIKEQYRKH
jgi:hypothetical protein